MNSRGMCLELVTQLLSTLSFFKIKVNLPRNLAGEQKHSHNTAKTDCVIF